MAIKSSSFGPVILSGDDAVRFAEQLKEPTPPQAIALAQRARSMAAEFMLTGEVTVYPSPTKGPAPTP